MFYTIKNDRLTLTLNSMGAEAWKLNADGDEGEGLLWDGKPDVWPRRAPLCFPWCGKLDDKRHEAFGRSFEAPQHGFARDVEHRCVAQSGDDLTFRLEWPGDSRFYPWPFSFETRYRLVDNQVITACTASNTGDQPMPVQIGFHPGFRCPFDPEKTAQDYFIRFEKPEAPDGSCIFELEEHVFDNDSICFPGPESAWVQLEERETGRYIRVGTDGCPFVLLWSKPGIPGFVCIEPWSGFIGEGHDLSRRPGAEMLLPGQSMTRTLRVTVDV